MATANSRKDKKVNETKELQQKQKDVIISLIHISQNALTKKNVLINQADEKFKEGKKIMNKDIKTATDYEKSIQLLVPEEIVS